MPAAAIVTVIALGLAVVVLAAYLIVFAALLRRVDSGLKTVIAGMRTVPDKTEGAGPAVESMNETLDELRGSLERFVDRPRRPPGDE